MSELKETPPEHILVHKTANGSIVVVVEADEKFFQEAIAGTTVEYVHADLFEAAQKRIADLERLNLTFAQNEQQIAALQTEVDRLREGWKADRAELTRRDNLDALNRRIDSYFE